MNDSISRQAAIDTARRLHDVAWTNCKETKISANTMIDALENLPSAEPEPKTGEWREHIFDGFMGCRPRALRCTRCNYISLSAYNFCPWCGADMRQRSDGNEND